MNNRETCSNCAWFMNEPLALDTKHQRIIDGIDPAIEYGKCQAEFIDNKGKLAKYDFGIFSGSECIATDDEGTILFEPKNPNHLIPNNG